MTTDISYLAIESNNTISNSVIKMTGSASIATIVKSPSIVSISPASGTKIVGKVSVQVAIQIGTFPIDKVEFYIDNSLFGVDKVVPYSAVLNARSLTRGIHTLLVKAYDTTGITVQATATYTK